MRTNFRMPDLISMGLGGGTIVRNAGAGDLRIGPDSVGYDVATEAICVGGEVLTLSDVSLAAGRMTGFGDPAGCGARRRPRGRRHRLGRRADRGRE